MAENELNQAQKTSENTSLLKNPVVLSGIFGATIVAFANVYIAFTNNNALVHVETQKENEEKL